MPLRKPIVVLDSNVVFSSLFSSKGYSFELLKLLRVGAFQIALTPPLLFSDVDLLVVVPHEGSAAKCAAEIRQAVDFGFPCDLLVRSPQKVAERLRMGDPFLREIFANGKTLYESTGT